MSAQDGFIQGEGEKRLSPCNISKARIVVVTGMSGAGKSIALRAFEDMRFEAIDNMPLSMIPDLIRTSSRSPVGLALGIDIRNRAFDAENFAVLLKELRTHQQLEVHVIFLQCDDDILQRRFTETRRKHPIGGERISDSIRNERALLQPLKAEADIVLDTSHFTSADLRYWIEQHFSVSGTSLLSLGILSFSFKQGLPREADMVFDVRFLRNPHYVEELRPLTGRDESVAAYIEHDPEFAPFFQRLTAFLLPLLPAYRREGKSYLTIAIGCTGGKHRSVCVAEKLYRSLQSEQQYRVEIRHLEIGG